MALFWQEMAETNAKHVVTAVTLTAYPIVHKDHDGAVSQRSNAAQS